MTGVLRVAYNPIGERRAEPRLIALRADQWQQQVLHRHLTYDAGLLRRQAARLWRTKTRRQRQPVQKSHRLDHTRFGESLALNGVNL